jgi:hypothetical protein
VAARPPEAVRLDGQHDQGLDEERRPDCPVEPVGDLLPGIAQVRFAEDDRRYHQRRSDQHRHVEPSRHPFTARVHVT